MPYPGKKNVNSTQKPTVHPSLILTHSLISIANYYSGSYYSNILAVLYSSPPKHEPLNNGAQFCRSVNFTGMKSHCMYSLVHLLFVRFIHVVTCIWSSCIYIFTWYVIHPLYSYTTTYLSILPQTGNLGTFYRQLESITNNTVTRCIHLHCMHVYMFLQDTYLEVKLQTF